MLHRARGHELLLPDADHANHRRLRIRRCAGGVDAIRLEKAAQRVRGHQHGLRRGSVGRGSCDLNRFQQRDAGKPAVAILRGADKIDLLFSDIAMPGSLNGYQLAMEAANLRPALKVVLTSAYANGVTKGAENRSAFSRVRFANPTT